MAVVTQIQIRRGTAAQWTSANPTLASGEFGYETDTGKFKIGDGSTAWTSLSYKASGTVTSITAGTGLSGGAITTSGTIAIDTATTVDVSTSQTLTNKTLTSPTITTPTLTLSGTSSITQARIAWDQTNKQLDVGDGTVVRTITADDATATLSNKTLVAPVLGTPTSGTLTNCTGLPVTGITASTSAALGVGTIELGNASDTTLSRSAAGVLAVEGVNVVTTSSTDTLTNKTLTAPVINISLNAQTGTTYTFVLADNGKLVTASNAAAQTYTIPLNSSVAYATGAQINIIQIGAGQVTIQGAGGVTVASTGATAATPKLRSQYSSATLIKVATDTWYVVGDIS